MSGRCETCDTNGPELPTLYADLLEFHRALHFAGRMIVKAVRRFLERYTR